MKIILNAKTLIILASCLAVVILVVFALFFPPEPKIFSSGKENSIIYNLSCDTSVEEKTVRGNSLYGLIEPGSTVKVYFGYYKCNEIKRGDIVAYNYSGDPNPIIKVVKGLPGDKLHLQEANGVWNILINGETVKNSKGEPYSLSASGSQMLSLYERDYKGVIPADAYLILGNLSSGSIDSTYFGLIGKNDILGKVELIHYAL